MKGKAIPIEEMHYSTDETVIGQWIDGKPIYRKSFMGTITNYNDYNDKRSFSYPFLTSIKNLIKADGSWSGNVNYFNVNLGATEINSGMDIELFDSLIRNNTLYINCHKTAVGLTSVSFVCTLEYTKTTD